MSEEKKSLFSAIQPSGILTLGNYIGAIRNWKVLMGQCDCIYALADLHTLTVKQVPAQLRSNTYELAALYIASGIDPDKCVFFVQSHVSAHTELAWILNTITYPGELQRMTQFKDKSRSHADNVNMGLMDYPVLMAADILLYNVDLVPVGQDQKQHLEITRDLAIRFNNRYSDTFKVPEPYISATGAKISSLQDPEKKMSKSDANVNAFISLNDDRDTIIRKFKRAVTDSDTEIRFSEDKPGISNLLTIYSCVTGKTISEAEKEFEGKGYGDFKIAVGEATADLIEPITKEKNKILSDKKYLDEVFARGAEQAERIARRTLSKVYRKVGLVERKH
ncbi:MAG: tryptophan--tRNA ligase [Sphaerochaetaceae bacterium]|nr:tryptophan--tRNA ligase [Sphaerochaetaceae bacterium]